MNVASKLIHRSFLLAGAALLTSTAALTTASAQGASASESEGIQEVIVTANKRRENAQKVPIAVASVSADLASKIGVVNGQTLAQVVPGLLLNRQTNGTQAFLRGVGTASTQAGNEPAVALYVDDVYMGSSALALTNYTGISRIDVLKGPQGTLFGRNATGGVIAVATRDPSAEQAVQVNLGYGNFNTVSGSLYATGALSSTVNANINVYSEKQNDGWGQNFTTGNPTYLQHNSGGRIKLKWSPSEATSVLFNIDGDNYFTQQAVYFRPAPGTVSSAGLVSTPPAGRYDTREVLDPEASVKQYGGSIKINHDFGAAQLVSISAYRHAKAIQDFEQDGASIYRQNPRLTYNTKTITQEFQVLSPESSSWNWVAGAFFLDDTSAVDPFIFRGSGPGLLGSAPNFLASGGSMTEQKTKSYAGFFQARFPIGEKAHVTAGARYTRDKRSMTGFNFNTNNAGALVPTTAIIAANPTVPVGTTIVPSPNNGISKTWSATTGRISFDYQFTDDIMGYVAANRGFKSGLFNTILGPSGLGAAGVGPPNTPAIDPPADPEHIDAISAGFKSEFLNNRVRLNVEAFHYKYKGLQMQQVLTIPGTAATLTRITNVAAASIKGIEFDLTYKATEHWTLSSSAQLMKGIYDDFPNGQFFVTAPMGGNCAFVIPNPSGLTPASRGPNPNGCLATPPNYNATTGFWNLKGNHTVQTPPFSMNVTSTWDYPVRNGDLSIALHFSHTGNYWAEPSNGQGQIAPATVGAISFSNPLNEKQQSVDILNASVGWTAPDDKWNVKLWGKNLTDEKYWGFNNSTGTVTKQVPAAPRTYGVSFGFNFAGEKTAPKMVKPIDSDGDGVTDDIDRCPATPAGTMVDASGCPLPKDSDGDGVMDPNDKCPATPAGVKVDASGCELDADGDGVVDRLDKCPNTVAGAKVNAEGCEMDADGDGVVDRLDKCPDTPKGDRVDYNGCSFKKELQLPGVVFETNKADLLAESSAVLDGAVSTLKRYPELQIEVAGHTDSTGSAPYNAALSKARAETVMKYLTDNGVTNTLKARGYGETQPVESNKTADGKQSNRRVVLRILNN